MTCGCAGTELHSRLPTTTSHHPAKKAAVLVFFTLIFFSFSPKMQVCARENMVIVCSNGCSNPQPDPEIPVKWRTGLETGMMLMLIWVCCLRSSSCHPPLNSCFCWLTRLLKYFQLNPAAYTDSRMYGQTSNHTVWTTQGWVRMTSPSQGKFKMKLKLFDLTECWHWIDSFIQWFVAASCEIGCLHLEGLKM